MRGMSNVSVLLCPFVWHDSDMDLQHWEALTSLLCTFAQESNSSLQRDHELNHNGERKVRYKFKQRSRLWTECGHYCTTLGAELNPDEGNFEH